MGNFLSHGDKDGEALPDGKFPVDNWSWSRLLACRDNVGLNDIITEVSRSSPLISAFFISWFVANIQEVVVLALFLQPVIVMLLATTFLGAGNGSD